MPSFSDSFWSPNYASGFNLLFDKLHQGCVENDEVLALAAARADAEEAYGNRLRDLPLSFQPKRTGFARDDGASLRKAYEGILDEMSNEGRHHLQVAESVRRMVLVPFGKWADEHRQRVEYSHSVIKGKLKKHDKELAEVLKCQKRYFNKCRVMEEFTEAGGDGVTTTVSTTASETTDAADTTESTEAESVAPDQSLELGDFLFGPEQAVPLLRRLLEEIPQKNIRVPILGTYDHVSSGDEIVDWAKANVPGCDSLAKAERFGQGLANEGFLRLVGQVGNKFANSSVMHYQWRKQAYTYAGKDLAEGQRDLITPLVGEYLSETFHNYISNPHPDESPEERLRREVYELDQRYKQAVQQLDDLRCNLEESAIDHLRFMERCEIDRLRAIKAVFLDFLAALSNVVPSIQSSVDKLLLYQETVHPSNDLRYILESYRTGSFSPKVTTYDNYYDSAADQTFGVDLELRCRGDRKRVPYIVSTILGHMDGQYPDLENDDVRLNTWIVSVPLKSTHDLRRELNTGAAFSRDLLNNYEAPIVASALKLYLVELPDSVIPSSLYDIVKSIYSQHGNDEDPTLRISAIHNTFSQLRVANLATLDAVTTHLTRLAAITKASPEYVGQLAQEFSHCLLRPRVQSALTLGDRHAYLLVKDLLNYREPIFAELKRHNSGTSTQTIPTASTPSSGTPVRRESLKDRMNALSLKMKSPGANSDASSSAKSANGSEAPSAGHTYTATDGLPRTTLVDESADSSAGYSEEVYDDAVEELPAASSDAVQSGGRHNESLTGTKLDDVPPEPEQ